MTQAIRVLLFARFREAVGAEVIEVVLAERGTVKDLRELIVLSRPSLASLLERSQIAINGELADDQALVGSEDEVALLPPVSGG
jgi:molybdopterin converting factor subunit 1